MDDHEPPQRYHESDQDHAPTIASAVVCPAKPATSSPIPAAAITSATPAAAPPEATVTPLIVAWSIWIAIGISTRSSEVRVAQQLSTLASLPSVVVTSLIAFDVIQASLGLAFALGATLLVLDRLGWRVTSALFDRERLIVGSR